jgi:hypothetical protein
MLGPNRPWICGVYVQPSHFSAQNTQGDNFSHRQNIPLLGYEVVMLYSHNSLTALKHSATCYTTTAQTYL